MAVIVQIGRVKPLADLVLVVAIAHGPRLHEQELLEGQLVVAVAVSLRKPQRITVQLARQTLRFCIHRKAAELSARLQVLQDCIGKFVAF